MSYEPIFSTWTKLERPKVKSLYPPFTECKGNCFSKKMGEDIPPQQSITPDRNTKAAPEAPTPSAQGYVQEKLAILAKQIDLLKKMPLRQSLALAPIFLPQDIIQQIQQQDPAYMKQQLLFYPTTELVKMYLQIASVQMVDNLMFMQLPEPETEGFHAVPVENFTWITDKIAVGNYMSDYQPFDVIVNLCYPQNGVNRYEIRKEEKDGKKKYVIGLLDSPDEPVLNIIREVIPELVNMQGEIKILFHCHAGISRSSTFAAAYYAKKVGCGATKAVMALREKRPIVNPNQGFIKALNAYLGE